jgi:hypothetical protein
MRTLLYSTLAIAAALFTGCGKPSGPTGSKSTAIKIEGRYAGLNPAFNGVGSLDEARRQPNPTKSNRSGHADWVVETINFLPGGRLVAVNEMGDPNDAAGVKMLGEQIEGAYEVAGTNLTMRWPVDGETFTAIYAIEGVVLVGPINHDSDFTRFVLQE